MKRAKTFLKAGALGILLIATVLVIIKKVGLNPESQHTPILSGKINVEDSSVLELNRKITWVGEYMMYLIDENNVLSVYDCMMDTQEEGEHSKNYQSFLNRETLLTNTIQFDFGWYDTYFAIDQSHQLWGWGPGGWWQSGDVEQETPRIVRHDIISMDVGSYIAAFVQDNGELLLYALSGMTELTATNVVCKKAFVFQERIYIIDHKDNFCRIQINPLENAFEFQVSTLYADVVDAAQIGPHEILLLKKDSSVVLFNLDTMEEQPVASNGRMVTRGGYLSLNNDFYAVSIRNNGIHTTLIEDVIYIDRNLSGYCVEVRKSGELWIYREECSA